jgi:hypothetical protein
MVTLNFNTLAAIAGCVALFICSRVIWPASRWRGLFLAGGGSAVIIGATLVADAPARALQLGGVVLAIGLLALLLVCLGLIARVRRQRGPRYQAPREISGACSKCAKSTHLTHYQQGWLCRACARRMHAKAA